MSILTDRRSIRTYEDREVPDDVIVRILKAGMHAPSTKNVRPWEFIVTKDRTKMTAIAEMSPYAWPLKKAAAAIIPCMNLAKDPGGFEGEWWMRDLSASTENMLLQITAEKLGGVWLGWHPTTERVERLSTYFNLPQEILPFAVIAFGYPAETPEPIDRYDESLIHWETY